MAIWNTNIQGRTTLGAESTRFDIQRAITNITTKTDVVVNVVNLIPPANAPIAWQAVGHGAATPTREYKSAIILADPDVTLTTPEQIRVEFSVTDVAGAVTTFFLTCDSTSPLLLGSADYPVTFDEDPITSFITQIRFLSEGTVPQPVRLLVLD